jgi:hypothetical protein
MFEKSYSTEVPKVSLKDRHLYKAYDSALMAICIFLVIPSQKKVFNTKANVKN